MSWHNAPMLAFDTETTGTDPFEARIVTACLATIRPGKPVEPQTWLVNPGVPIPAEATEVHGITDQVAQADGADPALVVADLANRIGAGWDLGMPLVAMNAAYDLTVLDCELRRHGLDSIAGLPMLVVDPLVIDRALDRYRPGKKRLEDLCRVYGVENDAAHDAAGDALAAARVAWKQAVKYPGALAKPLDELTSDQARWHRDWAAEFETYLRGVKDDPSIVIEREWPLRLAEVAS